MMVPLYLIIHEQYLGSLFQVFISNYYLGNFLCNSHSLLKVKLYIPTDCHTILGGGMCLIYMLIVIQMMLLGLILCCGCLAPVLKKAALAQ